MKAYDICMLIIFINIGFAFIGTFFSDSFSSDITGHANSIQFLKTVLTYPLVTVNGDWGSFSFTTIMALAGLMQQLENLVYTVK